uniref:Uncharacterized protein n=1 Tax=Salix viminalis TaxID=40686 RepID=A0A6N2LU72_SALVM
MAGSSNSGGDLRTPQFNGANYDFWAVKMETILIAYDLWDIVEGLPQLQQNPGAESDSIGEGSEAESTPEEKHAATRKNKIKNAKALSIIQGALSDDLFPRIRNERTAKGAWEILKREFRGDKKVRAVKLQAIRAEFEYMKMSDEEDLDDYLAKFFDIINNLKSLGEDVSEMRIVQKLLMSLSRRYKSIVSIIEETRDLEILRTEEVVASVKVFDRREGLYNEREKQRGSRMKTNQGWQGQNRRPTSWSQGGNMQSNHMHNNNQYSNLNYDRRMNHSSVFSPQSKTGSSIHSNVKPQCNTCQKFHFGVCRFKGQPKCGRCNLFGHNTNDCKDYKQMANCAQEEEEVTTNCIGVVEEGTFEGTSNLRTDSSKEAVKSISEVHAESEDTEIKVKDPEVTATNWLPEEKSATGKELEALKAELSITKQQLESVEKQVADVQVKGLELELKSSQARNRDLEVHIEEHVKEVQIEADEHPSATKTTENTCSQKEETKEHEECDSGVEYNIDMQKNDSNEFNEESTLLLCDKMSAISMARNPD